MLEAAAMVDDPADTVKEEVLTEEQRIKKQEGFKPAVFEGQRDVGHYVYDNMEGIYHRTKACVGITAKISEKGRLYDVRVVAGGDYELDALVVRVIEEMPLWTPATQDGIPVKSYWHYTFCY